MKARVIFFLVAMLGYNTIVFGQSNPTAQADGGKPASIYPNPVIPVPKIQGSANITFELPELTEEQKTCIRSFANKGMQSCLEDVAKSFATQKISIRPICCSALGDLQEACKSAVLFKNPAFEGLVKKYCASGDSATADDASDAASGSGGTTASASSGTGSASASASASGTGGETGPVAAADASDSTNNDPAPDDGATSAGSGSANGSAQDDNTIGNIDSGSTPATTGGSGAADTSD